MKRIKAIILVFIMVIGRIIREMDMVGVLLMDLYIMKVNGKRMFLMVKVN